MSKERRLESWLVGVAAAGLSAALVPLFAAWQHLPEPLAVHFGANGAPNGQLSRAGWALSIAAQCLLPLLLAWPWQKAAERSRGVRGAPLRLGLVAFMAALTSVLSWLLSWHNWEVAAWQAARPLQVWSLPVLLALPLLVGVLLGALARRWWPDSEQLRTGKLESLALASAERAYWSATAANGWLALVGAAVLAEGAVLALVLPKLPGGFLLLVLPLVMLVLEHVSRIRVSVDERALVIRYGRLGWLRQRIAIERIERAAAFTLDAWEHGGWGYRGSLKLRGRAAVVVRNGPAIRLWLRGGGQLCITVDDAETGARLINGFVRRDTGLPVDAPAGAKLAH